MAEVIWTEPALQELDAIAEYIALDNPVAASALVKDVFDKTERLENFPKSGRIPPELPDSVYRELVVPPCSIFIVRMSCGFWCSLSCERSDSFVHLCLNTAKKSVSFGGCGPSGAHSVLGEMAPSLCNRPGYCA